MTAKTITTLLVPHYYYYPHKSLGVENNTKYDDNNLFFSPVYFKI